MGDTDGLTEVEWLRKSLNRAIDIEYTHHRQLHGKMFRGKKGTAVENYTPMSFSRTLLDLAGGIRELLANWEEYPL